MPATRTVILGGGFGGLAVATELRGRLGPEHEIVVVDRGERFYVGLRKLWVLVGRASLEEGERPRARLEGKGIRFLRTEVTGIDPEARRVETAEGRLTADFLVVALGAEPRPDLVPGLAEHAFDLYEPDRVKAAAARLEALEGGRAGVAIAGLPYKCPPAPYEAVLLLDDRFRERGIRDAVELSFSTLQPALLPNAGPEGARWVGEQMTGRGISWKTGRKVVRFEAGRVVYEEGERELDVAIAVPPHRAPEVVRASGLTGEGAWVAVDRSTLRTRFDRVFAIGDVTEIPLPGGAALPKAGLFAEAEGHLVARAIAAEVAGGPPPEAFDGRGSCFLELDRERAALVEGDFFAEGGPAVRIAGESAAHLEEKRRFESERLDRWLGEGREKR